MIMCMRLIARGVTTVKCLSCNTKSLGKLILAPHYGCYIASWLSVTLFTNTERKKERIRLSLTIGELWNIFKFPYVSWSYK